MVLVSDGDLQNTRFLWRWVVHIYNTGPNYYEGLVVVILSDLYRELPRFMEVQSD